MSDQDAIDLSDDRESYGVWRCEWCRDRGHTTLMEVPLDPDQVIGNRRRMACGLCDAIHEQHGWALQRSYWTLVMQVDVQPFPDEPSTETPAP